MKVGDYVRTKYRIRKITNLETYCNLIVETDKGDLDIDKIVKSSPNIIDLIEVGDYVNGMQVTCKYENLLEIQVGHDDYYYLENRDIKSVVTKEQFEEMKYEIK